VSGITQEENSMKLLVLTIVITCSLTVCAESYARDQKIIFNTDSISHRSGTSEYSCKGSCNQLTNEDINDYLDNGWKIISSQSKEKIAENYFSNYGCTCIGTQFVIEKKNSKAKEPIPKYKPNY
jgi:hypothetical protein